MKNEKSDHVFNLEEKRKASEETLEISSSGYGLVYVTNENDEEQKLNQKK